MMSDRPVRRGLSKSVALLPMSRPLNGAMSGMRRLIALPHPPAAH